MPKGKRGSEFGEAVMVAKPRISRYCCIFRLIIEPAVQLFGSFQLIAQNLDIHIVTSGQNMGHSIFSRMIQGLVKSIESTFLIQAEILSVCLTIFDTFSSKSSP